MTIQSFKWDTYVYSAKFVKGSEIKVRPIFTDKIAIEYAVDLPRDVASPSMIFTVGDGTPVTVAGRTTTEGMTVLADAVGGERTWYFTCEGILPSQLGASIKATVVGADVEIPVWSVKDYCVERLNFSNNQSFKQLISELLRYGAAAEEYTTGVPSTVANVSGILPTTVYSKTYTNRFNNPGSVWKGATLIFDSTIAMRLYYNGDVAPTVSDVKCAAHHAVTVNTEGKYIEITGFTPLDYDEEISATIGNSTVRYSVGSYILRMSEDGSNITKRIVNAMYDYGRAALNLTE